MATPANLTFLPWTRQGAAAAIATADTLTSAMRGAADLKASLTVNGAAAASIDVRLRGPADVAGIDPHEIVRVDPRPGTRDFEPNYFPCIEFDRPDFPWLFTPARADAQGRLRPWLCLVVVRQTDGVTLGRAIDNRLPALEIAAPARPGDELPDLAESWAWAHAQAASDTQGLRDALAGRPELSLSRLLCPRRLDPNTEYLACLVPAFDLGRRAGLGEPVTDADVTGANALQPAWISGDAAPPRVTLPVYYSWSFCTGANEDFESLVRLLHAELAPARLGLRAVDISRPGFALPASVPAGSTLDIEGALQPLERPDAPAPWTPAIAAPFQSGLAAIVNAPGLANTANPADDPLLAPPLYGRYHAARPTAAINGASWFDDLNLDPRHRIVAAFGTSVVQTHQEALMAAAWDQAGDLQHANERVRRLQLSLAVNISLQARHFARLDDETLLRVSAPVFARLRGAGPGPGPNTPAATLLAGVRASKLPVEAFSAPMRRLGRQRGPLSRRVVSQGAARVLTRNWIGILNGVVAPPTTPPFTLATFADIIRRIPIGMNPRPFRDVTAQAVNDMRGRPGFNIVPEGGQVIPPPLVNLPPSADDATAAAFRGAAREHLARIDPARIGFLTAPPPALRIGELRTALVAQTRPQVTIRALARATIAVGANATPPAGDTPQGGSGGTTNATETAGVDTIMAAPKFSQPMYEALRDLGQDLLLPGLDDITPNTVLGLKTNRRFVEAYLIGLNVEMGRELLWRGFPTDERGTCFDQFWDARTADTPRPDIGPIHRWGNRRLGGADNAPAREQFVLLFRSDLLRRYPTAVIYATPARIVNGVRSPVEDPNQEKYPAFRGSMQPDVSFFGFDISPTDMVRGNNGAGHYIVIQEQPTEPRFGLDIGTPAGAGTHVRVRDGLPAGLPLNGLEWGRNAAHLAGLTRQLPVRIAIHASRFVQA